MLTLQTVEAIIEYYARTRSAGHTTAMIEGAKNTEGAIVIVNDAYQAVVINKTLHKVKAIPATGDIDILLRGRHSPLLIDHYVITRLFSMLSLERIVEVFSLQRRTSQSSLERLESVSLELEHYTVLRLSKIP